MNRHVVIVSGLQVTDNPRVVKEADALAELGYRVTVLTAVHSVASLPRIDALLATRRWRHVPVVDLTDRRVHMRLMQFALRAAARLVRGIKARFGWEHPLQLGFETWPLWWAARREKADLYSLHLEKSLWVGQKLLARGDAVRMDVEDWNTEDGLPQDRGLRPLKLMRRGEALLLNRAVHTTATSDAMADALVAAYDCPRPLVIYNSFPTADREAIDGKALDRPAKTGPSIIWFSQTIGPGRGLEALVGAFAQLSGTPELHLRGTPRAGYVESLLEPLAPDQRARVFVHPQVPQDALLSRLAEHDIGYCGELNNCANSNLTIANKAFEYMRAGLAVVASDTAGQAEMADTAPLAVHLFRQGDAPDLRRVLQPLIDDPEVLARSREAAADALVAHFSWEASKQRLQEQVAGYFEALPS